MPKKMKLITNIITLTGIEKIKTIKDDNKTLWRIFLSPKLLVLLANRQQTLKWLPDFDWLLDSVRLFDSHFSLVLARKMLHNARQSDNNTKR